MKKTRGQVSVRGKLYDKLKIVAEAQRKSISQLVEEAVLPVLDQAEAQAVDSAPVEG